MQFRALHAVVPRARKRQYSKKHTDKNHARARPEPCGTPESFWLCERGLSPSNLISENKPGQQKKNEPA